MRGRFFVTIQVHAENLKTAWNVTVQSPPDVLKQFGQQISEDFDTFVCWGGLIVHR